MNLDKIIKDSPRAWEECLLFLGYNEKDIKIILENPYLMENGFVVLLDGEYTEHGFHYRRLYDYFDSVGVVVFVYYDFDAGWCYEVVYDNECDRERWYESRQDVEFEAIPKAFEIREQQLGDKE